MQPWPVRFKRWTTILRCDYRGDGFGVRNRSLGFMTDPAFARAWDESVRLNAEVWRNFKTGVPDVRWRAHTCCWAARHALSIEGDFVEFGVNTGLLSVTVCNFLDFAKLDRKFWLFDTYAGIPVDRLTGEERGIAEMYNKRHYSDCYELAKRNFAPFPNAHLVQGILPESIDDAKIEKVAYLAIDLNNATAEKLSIEKIWPKLSKGAIIVLDDYAFSAHELQYAMWNDFAASVGQSVLTMPTGQGVIVV